MEMGAQKRFIAILFGSSLITRLSLFFYYTCHGRNAWVYVDSDQYHLIAVHFLKTGSLCLQPEGLMSYRLPGYPLYLAFWYWLGGIHQWLPLLVQIVCASFIPPLLFLLSRRLFPAFSKSAQIAGWLACFHVGFVLYAGMLATETFFVLFFLLFLFFFLPCVLFNFLKTTVRMDSTSLTTNGNSVRPERSVAKSNGYERVKHFAFAGFFLGLASMFRPLGHYVLVLAWLLLFFSSFSWMQKIKAFGALSASWFVVVLPWLARNTILFGVPFFHSLPGLHFLQYPAARVTSCVENISYPAARQKVLAQWQREIEEKENDILFAHPECRPHPSIHFASQNTSDFAKGYAGTQQDERSVYRRTLTTNGLATAHPELRRRMKRALLNEYERCRLGEKQAFSLLLSHPFYVGKDAAIELCKTVFGLYSAIILLGDDMPWPDYGAHTPWQNKVKRFLLPVVKRPLLVPVIYADMIMLLLLLVGFFLFIVGVFRKKYGWDVLAKILPFIALFIVVTSAYGGARLRMPADLLFIMGAAYGLLWCCKCAK